MADGLGEAAEIQDAAERRAEAARALTAQVHDHVGVRVQVAVGDPDTIERSAGKMRRVVDQRNR